MNNATNICIPKKYHDSIREIYKDQDGYWVVLNTGYYASGLGGYDEAHTIHEDTVKELLKQVRQIKEVTPLKNMLV